MNLSPREELHFQLILEGPVNNNPETLKSLRFVLLTKLDLDIEKAQSVLQQAPIAIRESKEESELEPFLQSIIESGGRALIVRHAKLVKEKVKPAVPHQNLSLSAQPTKKKQKNKKRDQQVNKLIKGLETRAIIDKSKKPKNLSLKEHIVLTNKEITRSGTSTKRAKPKKKAPKPLPPFPPKNREELNDYYQAYRKNLNRIDRRLRKTLNEEFILSAIIFSFLTLATFALLIPLELYHSAHLHSRFNKTAELIDSYVDIVVYGDIPGSTTKGGEK